MYNVFFTKEFNKHYAKLTKNNKNLQDKTKKTIEILQESPFYSSLKTHRANTKTNEEKWCSWVAPDLRIAWDFGKNNTIVLYNMGTHSGKYRLYN